MGGILGKTVLLVFEITRTSFIDIIGSGGVSSNIASVFLNAYCVHIQEKRSEHMETKERVRKAVETYDHLLWEAIIEVCGVALSKSFERMGNQVRVVYQTCANEPYVSFEKTHYLERDPRRQLRLIEIEVEKLVSLSLPIQKLGKKSYETLSVAKHLCSRYSYQDFLQNILREKTEYECDFVEFGRKGFGGMGEKGYICCPCIGEHLENTRDLATFKVDLQKPEKVGKDTYEFRFTIN